MDRDKEFLEKLFALMQEYKADIHFTCKGDMYGICDEQMIVSINNKTIHQNQGFWLEKD